MTTYNELKLIAKANGDVIADRSKFTATFPSRFLAQVFWDLVTMPGSEAGDASFDSDYVVDVEHPARIVIL